MYSQFMMHGQKNIKSSAISVFPLWARVACYRVKPHLALQHTKTSYISRQSTDPQSDQVRGDMSAKL